MTKNESAQALKAYNIIDNLLSYHNKNLTNKQYNNIDDVRDILRELSQKAYEQTKKDY